MQKLIWVGVVLIAAGAGAWYFLNHSGPTISYRTAKVERGDLRVGINTTGTLQAEEVVDVGAQVAGMIVSLGTDLRDPNRMIDYCSPVEVGTILARIEDSVYVSQVNSAKAMHDQALGQLASAEAQVAQGNANIQRAEADLQQFQAKVFQTDRDWTRTQKLAKENRGAVSDVDYDTAEAAFKTAKANEAVGKAAISQAKATLLDAQANVLKAKGVVADAKANLDRAETNLGYCTIKSPVKGVIIDRRINVGQTVVSSLNAPSLFLLAKDLTKMQVWCPVNEADIAQIKSGQKVRFTIDTYPGRVFEGVVAPDQPRLNASMTSNVVTYMVIVNTNNKSLELLPYLTANVDFEVNRRSNVLLVPNSALRWKPPSADLIVPEAKETNAESASKRPPSKGKTDKPAEKERTEHGTVWVQEGELFRPLRLQLGPSDGVKTEIVGGELKEGDVVMIGTIKKDVSAGGGGSPFTPQMFNNKK